VGLNLLKLLSGILLAFFYIGYNKNGIFDGIIITSTLRSDKLILKANFTCF